MKHLPTTIHQKGFTLIEMIVSIAIFTIVALVAVGALLKIIDANKVSQSQQTVINSMDFTLESMSRELRTGSNYYCITGTGGGSISFAIQGNTPLPSPTSCSPSASPQSWLLAFYSSQTEPNGTGGTCNLIHIFMYDLPTKSLSKAEQAGIGGCSQLIDSRFSLYTFNSNGFSVLIATTTVFTTAQLSVQTSDSPTPRRPLVFFHFAGYAGIREQDRTYFDLQSTVSQRYGQ